MKPASMFSTHRKRLWMLILVPLLLVVLLPGSLMPVWGKGSSSIILDPGEAGSLRGRVFAIYRVLDGSVSSQREGVHYTWNASNETALKTAVARMKGGSASTLSLQDVLDYMESTAQGKAGSMQSGSSQYRRFIETLGSELQSRGTPQKRITIRTTAADGSYTVDGLGLGYFVVVEETDLSALKEPAAISLCLALSGDGSSTRVKLKNELPVLQKKIREDRDGVWNDLGDFQCGQNIPYRLESAIRNLEAYSKYRMVFHDVMDAGLAFDAESLSVTLVDSGREHRLAASDYSLKTPDGAETFTVRIDDVKALLGKCCPDALAQNRYGQTLRVEFTAHILTEAFKTEKGVRGLENSARLEFSANPGQGQDGQSGYTPWDSVVCYSYALQITKTDLHNRPLSDAVFTLSSDPEGKQPVALQHGLDGYIVMDADALAADSALSFRKTDAISNTKGLIAIYGLDEGTYYLHEKKAPDGYQPLAKPVRIELHSSFGIDRNSYERGMKDLPGRVLSQISGQATLVEHYALQDHTSTIDLSGTPADARLSMQVSNRPGSRLPLTGSQSGLLCLGGGSAVVLVTLFVSFCSGRKGPKTGGRMS